MLRICAIREKSQDAFVTVRSQCVQIEKLAVNGSRIDLEITSVNDRACRRLYGKGECIDDRVCDVEKLDTEATDLDGFFGRDGVKLRFFEDSVLFELVLDESHRELGTIYGHIQIRNDEGKRADVVFV